jgi:hypothetical protein
MPVHSVVPVQGIGGALTILETSVLPAVIGQRTPVWKPRVAVIASHHLVEVIVASPAWDRREGDGQNRDDCDKGLVHDRLDLLRKHY